MSDRRPDSNGGRPLVFLDVDGPLLPFGAPPWDAAFDGPDDPGNPLLAGLDPAHGPRLAALPGELVWATSWMDDANEEIAPRLGLPVLPVVAWPEDDEPFDRAGDGLHWKTRAVVAYAAGRPFVWIDDETTAADGAWVAAHHPAPALLHRVDSRRGLTPADFTAVEDWLAGLRRGQASGP